MVNQGMQYSMHFQQKFEYFFSYSADFWLILIYFCLKNLEEKFTLNNAWSANILVLQKNFSDFKDIFKNEWENFID